MAESLTSAFICVLLLVSFNFFQFCHTLMIKHHLNHAGGAQGQDKYVDEGIQQTLSK